MEKLGKTKSLTFFEQLLISTFLFLLSVVFSGTNGMAEEESLSISGCKTATVSIQSLAHGLQNDLPFSTRIVPTGNINGLKRLLSGEADLAVTAKDPKYLAKKFPFVAENLARFHVVPYARDSYVVIVNHENPISDISKSDLQRIYMGEINNWKQLGGKDGEIWPLRLDPKIGSGLAHLFQMEVLGPQKKFSKKVRLMHSPRIAADYVRKFPNTITYSSFSDLPGDLKIISINGITPTRETILNGTYPAVLTHYFVAMGLPVGNAKEFIDRVISPEGQKMISEFSFPINKDVCGK